MASLLDQFFAATPGGLFGALATLPPQLQAAVLSQLDPAWQAQQQGPPPGPSLRYDPTGPATMVDLRGGGQLMAPPGPQRVAAPQLGIGGGGGPEQFPQLGGFGVSPGSMVGLPADVPMPRVTPPRPAPPLPDPLVISDENLPPSATPTSGRGTPLAPAAAANLRNLQAQAQAQQYTPPPQQEPGFLDRIGAGFSNLLNNPSLPGLVEGARGFASGRYTDPTSIAREYQQATYTNLRRAGYSHADAAMAANNPMVLKQLVEQAYAPQKLQGFQPGEGVYATGGGGLGGAGRLNVQQLTPGLSPEELAAQRAGGEARGKAAFSLPSTLQTADQALSVIDQLQNHPGKSLAVGRMGPIPLNLIPAIGGTEQGNFVTLLQQAEGQTFLQAYQQLKGGGAISEAEGAKAQAAIGRLSRAQTPAAFDQALNELRGVITAGRANALSSARGGAQGYTPPTPVAGWTTVTTPNGPARIRERR